MKPETFDSGESMLGVQPLNCESADKQLNASTTPTRSVVVCM